MEAAKELLLYQDSKVVAKRMRQAKIQPLREYSGTSWLMSSESHRKPQRTER